jgi:hypothetical protein
MSLRGTLSVNLARLCEREDSIAAVCRATRINRQQFNRYLAGDSLPNQRNREKICRYFRIGEPELFREKGEKPSKIDGDSELSWSAADVRAALRLMHSEVRASLSPGLYFANFAIPNDQNSLMRSALAVRSDGNLTTFRRLTGMSERRGSWWSRFLGDHQGIILERRHWLYLVGLNRYGNREPTLMVLRWLPNSQPMLGGHATIMNPSGPTITAVVVSACEPSIKLRAAIEASHAYALTDPTIDPMILDALDQQCQALVSMTRRLDLGVRPMPLGHEVF